MGTRSLLVAEGSFGYLARPCLCESSVPAKGSWNERTGYDSSGPEHGLDAYMNGNHIPS